MTSRNSGQKIKIAERRRLAVEMRKQGGTFRQIAEAMKQQPGVSDRYGASQAIRDIQAELERIQTETSAEVGLLRTLEIERLDDLWRVYYPRAMKGDVVAMDRCMTLLDRRARLIAGLYPLQPTTVQVSGPNGGPIETKDVSLTDEQRLSRFAALLDAARARRDGQAPGDDAG